MGSCDITEPAVLKRENLLSLLLVLFVPVLCQWEWGRRRDNDGYQNEKLFELV